MHLVEVARNQRRISTNMCDARVPKIIQEHLKPIKEIENIKRLRNTWESN